MSLALAEILKFALVFLGGIASVNGALQFFERFEKPIKKPPSDQKIDDERSQEFQEPADTDSAENDVAYVEFTLEFLDEASEPDFVFQRDVGSQPSSGNSCVDELVFSDAFHQANAEPKLADTVPLEDLPDDFEFGLPKDQNDDLL